MELLLYNTVNMQKKLMKWYKNISSYGIIWYINGTKISTVMNSP